MGQLVQRVTQARERTCRDKEVVRKWQKSVLGLKNWWSSQRDHAAKDFERGSINKSQIFWAVGSWGSI